MLGSIERKRILTISKFLRVAHNKDALFFMCYRNYKTNSDFFRLDFNPNYLPVPVPVPVPVTAPKCSPVIECDVNPKLTINIGWLSRLTADKVNILNLLIIDLDKYCKKNKSINIYLHIIGDGNCLDKIINTDFLTIIKAGTLTDKHLTRYIESNLDLGFAMGTSALEFASRALPTLLVPSSTLYDYYKEASKKYLWLYDANNYDVATEIYNANEALTIDDILLNPSPYFLSYHGCLSYNYTIKYHSIESIGASVKNSLLNSNLSALDISSSKIFDSNHLELLLLVIKSSIKKIFNKPKS